MCRMLSVGQLINVGSHTYGIVTGILIDEVYYPIGARQDN